jgi:hypothetical protein
VRPRDVDAEATKPDLVIDPQDDGTGTPPRDLVLAPERAPVALLSVDDRVQQALALGVDGVVVLPFLAMAAAG